jgi:hypothetical protein
VDPFLLSSVSAFVENLIIVFSQINMNFVKDVLILLIVFIEGLSMVVLLVMIHGELRSEIVLCHRNVLKTDWLVLKWSSCLGFE